MLRCLFSSLSFIQIRNFKIVALQTPFCIFVAFASIRCQFIAFPLVTLRRGEGTFFLLFSSRVFNSRQLRKDSCCNCVVSPATSCLFVAAFCYLVFLSRCHQDACLQAVHKSIARCFREREDQYPCGNNDVVVCAVVNLYRGILLNYCNSL